jgi:hypothetical protein
MICCLIMICIQIIRIHYEHMAAIESLQPFTTTIDDKTVTVQYEVVDTMHDGKEITILVKDILRCVS